MRDLLFWFSGAVLAASLVFGGATRRSGFRSHPGTHVLAAARVGATARHAFLKEFPLRASPRRRCHSPAQPPANPAAAGIVERPARPEFRRRNSDDRPSPDIVEADFSNPERDRARLALTAPGSRHILGGPKPRAGCTTTLAARCASDRDRSAVLGMLQVLGGGRRDLYLFAVTNEGTAVGFFANHNHLAALEYALLPLGAAALAETLRQSTAFLVAILGAVAAALLFALTLTGSRSAMILGSFGRSDACVHLNPRAYSPGPSSLARIHRGVCAFCFCLSP